MHLDILLFILLIATAALLRLLTSKAGTGRKPEPPPREPTFVPRANQPQGRSTPDTDEERIRRFLEALGQPASSKPPEPVAPRSDIPPRPLAPVKPPPGMFGVPAGRLSPEERRKRRVILPKSSGYKPEEWLAKEQGTAAVKTTVEPATVYRAEVPAPEIVSFETSLVQETSDTSGVPATTAPPSSVDTRVDIVSLLASPRGLRQMVVLREILGPPRGLQPFELIGSA